MHLKPSLKLYLRIFLITVSVSFSLAALVLLGAAFGVIDTTADLDLDNLKLNFSSIVYYNDEDTSKPAEYERLYDQENRTWVSLDKVPEHLKNAVVAIEDERYYKHRGVDFLSTSKAVFDHFFSSDGRGASTITQQLVKNLTGDNQVTITRKALEIFRALNVERKLSKDQILELYLNTIYLSNGCNGVGSAANLYFDKPISNLSLAESALIAGITQYPSKFDPINNFESSKEKQEIVLSKMLSLGMISKEEHDSAIDEKLTIHKTKSRQYASKQSYFVDQIINDVLSDLINKKGYSEAIATKMIYTGGLRIYSTVDPKIQASMDEVFSNLSNFPKVNKDPSPQSAMVVIDPYTGAIKGIVGGLGPKTGDRTLNRAAQAMRQPGSTIKPIGVYAPALEKGTITPYSVYEDKPITFGSWSPKNYYNGFRGNMTVKYAVEQSVNTVAVQILDKIGVDYSYNFMKKNLGVNTLVDQQKRKDGNIYSDKNLSSLALGGLTDGVTLVELAAAYAPFINRGIYTEPYTYTRVVDSAGKVLLENKKQTNIAMSEQTAYTMTNLLHSVVTSGTGGAANFRSDMDICGKTGTTDKDVDRWFVGYTPYYLGVVWYGFDMPSSMSFLSSNPTIPVWKTVMSKIHQGLPSRRFPKPSGYKAPVIDTEYCIDSGAIPSELCERDVRGSRVETGVPTKTGTCTLHQEVTVDTSTKMLATGYCPASVVKTYVVLSTDITEDSIKIGDEIYKNTPCTKHNQSTPKDEPIPTLTPINLQDEQGN